MARGCDHRLRCWARSALENVASVSTLLLTSDALVAEMPKDEKKPAGGGEDTY